MHDSDKTKPVIVCTDYGTQGIISRVATAQEAGDDIVAITASEIFGREIKSITILPVDRISEAARGRKPEPSRAIRRTRRRPAKKR